jgi:hypothetical protein
MILNAIRKRWPWLKYLFADGGYDRTQLMDKAVFLDFVVEIVRRMKGKKASSFYPALGRRAHLCLDDPMVAARVRLRTTHQAGGRIAPTSERDWIRLRLARQFVEQRRDAKGFKALRSQRRRVSMPKTRPSALLFHADDRVVAAARFVAGFLSVGGWAAWPRRRAALATARRTVFDTAWQ